MEEEQYGAEWGRCRLNEDGRRSEERCIVLIDTDQTNTYDVKKEKKELTGE